MRARPAAARAGDLVADAVVAATVTGVNGLGQHPTPAPPGPPFGRAGGPSSPFAHHAAARGLGVRPPAPRLPDELGPERVLPDMRTAPERPRGARHRKHRPVTDTLWIPAVSHLPSRDAVIRQSRRGVQAIAACVACVSLAGAGFLGWDLWASSWYAGHQQTQLAAELESTTAVALPAAPPAPAAADSAAAVPAAPLPAPPPQLLIDHATLETGAPVGRLLIDKIALDETFVYGTGVAELKSGPGLWKWGVAPGHPGNAMISGHRTTYGAPFHDIDKLVPGDRITVQIPGQNDAVYEVRGTQIVTPQDVQVSDQTPGVRLTLTACHPLGSARERIIVQAELVAGDNVAYALPADLWAFQS